MFALAGAMAIIYWKKRAPLTLGLLAGSVVLLALVYLVRFRQREEWDAFFQRENTRLLQMRGSSGPARYVAEQRAALKKIRHPELKLSAKLNLCAGLLANADPGGTLEVLEAIQPEKIPNPTLLLLYWTQALSAFLQRRDLAGAETAYETAMGILPDVSDVVKVSFMPLEIQYRLARQEYVLALDQLNEIPKQGLDEASQDLLTALRVNALRGLGAREKADKLAAQLADHDLIPSTRALLRCS